LLLADEKADEVVDIMPVIREQAKPSCAHDLKEYEVRQGLCTSMPCFDIYVGVGC